MPAPTLSRSRSPRAFTLIELLVVISIIALLIGILLPALGNARETAKQIKALSANRQLLVGYTAYQNDYDGHVMFGYPPALVDGEPFKVRLPSGHTFSSDVDLAFPIVRYPARMAEYQGHAWEILYDHIPPSDRPSSSDTQQQAWSKLYNLSVFPSFGINATYVGGDDHGKHGFVGDKPNRGKHVVFKQVEVRRASGLIVFADAIQRGGGIASGVNGYHLATPPPAPTGRSGTPKAARSSSTTPAHCWAFRSVVTALRRSRVSSTGTPAPIRRRSWTTCGCGITSPKPPMMITRPEC